MVLIIDYDKRCKFPRLERHSAENAADTLPTRFPSTRRARRVPSLKDVEDTT